MRAIKMGQTANRYHMSLANRISSVDTVILIILLTLAVELGVLVPVAFAQAPGYAERYRPVIGGVQIQGFLYPLVISTCSLAFPVYDSEYGNAFLTAGHCYELTYPQPAIYQPTIFPMNEMGYVVRDSYPNYVWGGTVYIVYDAAVIALNEGWPYYVTADPYIYDPEDFSNDRVGITGYEAPEEGDHVVKSGRTTGVTHGIVRRFDQMACWPWGFGEVCVTGLTVAERDPAYNDPVMVASGDSGGAVYRRYTYYQWEFGLRDYAAYVQGIIYGGDENVFLYSNFVDIIQDWPLTVYTCEAAGVTWCS